MTPRGPSGPRGFQPEPKAFGRGNGMMFLLEMMKAAASDDEGAVPELLQRALAQQGFLPQAPDLPLVHEEYRAAYPKAPSKHRELLQSSLTHMRGAGLMVSAER